MSWDQESPAFATPQWEATGRSLKERADVAKDLWTVFRFYKYCVVKCGGKSCFALDGKDTCLNTYLTVLMEKYYYPPHD